MITGCLNCNQDYESDTQGAICPHEVGGPNTLPPWPKRAIPVYITQNGRTYKLMPEGFMPEEESAPQEKK